MGDPHDVPGGNTMTSRQCIRLLALLASFAIAGYAGVRLLAGNPTGVGAWFVGSAVVHDLVLFPLYAGVDAALVALLRRRPALATVAGVPWLNHLRVPAVVSGVLLLVWSPLILRLPTTTYLEASGLPVQPYLSRWLAVTAALFVISAATLTVRRFRIQRAQRAQRAQRGNSGADYPAEPAESGVSGLRGAGRRRRRRS